MMRLSQPLFVVLALTTAVSAQTPLKVIEDGVLDRIELFALAPENPKDLTVVIRPFDATAADLGSGGTEGKEKRQQEAQTMQNEGPRVLAEKFVSSLTKAGLFKEVRVIKADEVLTDGVILLEGKFVVLDPGSRAKRYWAGFGAGKSSVKVVGTLKDAQGKVLATFEQRRIGAVGFGGGDSLGKLMSDSRSIGEDLAKFVAKWGRGDGLDQD